MTAKDELLNRAAREYNAFEAAIHGLNEDHLTEVWFGSWSIRDIVAHVSGWHREMGPAIERLARGEKPLPEGVAGLVYPCLEPGRLHLAEEPTARLLVSRPPARSGDATAIGIATELGKALDVRFEARERNGDGHGARSIPRSRIRHPVPGARPGSDRRVPCNGAR